MSPARRAQVVPLARPVPEASPEYDHAAGHTRGFRGFDLHALLDTVFIIVGMLVSVWLGILYLREGFALTPVRLLYVVCFWLLLTYIALPRLHQVLTLVYLPDYFFGRTRSAEGVLADPINLALDGTEQDLHVAMRRAGWALAEERTLRSSWGMIRATLLRRSYPQAPVSDLYLRGRRHDFCYQQEVGGTTTKRHHVRFWRMPKDFALPGGYRVDWLAAGTYDRAVGFSFFTLQITHRIDENVDVERDYIIDTIRYADPAVEVDVIKEFSASYNHRNGGGDRIRTDGDLPVVDLHGAAQRSDGASAMMLPRHRPTGTSVMRARAYEAAQAARRARRADLAGHISEQWHGTVGDLQEAWAGAGDHHMPPPTVVLTGALVALQAVIVAGQLVARLLGIDLKLLAWDVVVLLPHADALGWAAAFCVVTALLVVGVIRRNRWARLLLMTLFSADAVVRLALATAVEGHVKHAMLVAVGASVLGLLAISSDASRLWVQTERLDRRSEDAEEPPQGHGEKDAQRAAGQQVAGLRGAGPRVAG